MANEEQVKILLQGVAIWNKWREENPEEKVDLNLINLSPPAVEVTALWSDWSRRFGLVDLREVNFERAELTAANLRLVDLREARLKGALLFEAKLNETNFEKADLEEASLFDAESFHADFGRANLRRATITGLRGTFMTGAKFTFANLEGADLQGTYLQDASFYGARLSGADLSGAVGFRLDDTQTRDVRLGPAPKERYNQKLCSEEMREAAYPGIAQLSSCPEGKGDTPPCPSLQPPTRSRSSRPLLHATRWRISSMRVLAGC